MAGIIDKGSKVKFVKDNFSVVISSMDRWTDGQLHSICMIISTTLLTFISSIHIVIVVDYIDRSPIQKVNIDHSVLNILPVVPYWECQ